MVTSGAPEPFWRRLSHRGTLGDDQALLSFEIDPRAISPLAVRLQ